MEVYKKCPNCYKRSVLRIPQIILEFDNFDLDDFEFLKKLNNNQLFKLRAAISGKSFVCKHCDHEGYWWIHFQDADKEELIEKLFKCNERIY